MLQSQHEHKVFAYLMNAGAAVQEAHEVVDALWGDLLIPGRNGRPRLTRFSGTCALQTWLNTVALNALLTRKRVERRRAKLFYSISQDDGGGTATLISSEPLVEEPTDTPLLTLMREAVEFAFRECPAEQFVLLQLEYCTDLEREELALMFGCSKSTIHRLLIEARESIAEATFRYVHTEDPWLDLNWEDFLELCRVATPGCFGLLD